MATRPKRSKRTATDAELDMPPAKRGPVFEWDAFRQKTARLFDEQSFQELRATVGDALTKAGACRAAVSNVKHDKKTLERARDFIFSRDSGSLATLRMHALIGCPGPVDTARVGAYPCHLKKCAWRFGAHELAPPSGAPLFQIGGGDVDAFQLAQLPYEIVCSIVRIIAYDFRLLRTLRSVCRALRNAVDAQLPTILVDCSLIVIRDGSWALSSVLNRFAFFSNSRTRPLTSFRQRPCSPMVGALLASPGHTIAVLARRYARVEWSRIIGVEQMGDAYHTSLVDLVRPFQSDAVHAQLARISTRIRALVTQGIHAPVFRSVREAEAWIVGATAGFGQTAVVNAGLDALCVVHAIKYSGINRRTLMVSFARYCADLVRAGEVDPETCARAGVDRLLAFFNAEAAAIDQCATEHNLSFSVLYAHGLRTQTIAGDNIHILLHTPEAVLETTRARVNSAAQSFTHNPIPIALEPTGLLQEINRCNLPPDLVNRAMHSPVGRTLLGGIAAFTKRLRGNHAADAHVAAICAEFTPALEALQ